MLLCAAVREWWVEKGSGEDESIESFASRRFGQKVARRLFDPLALGIYAGDISRLSIRSCFPTLWQFEREKGSVVRGMMKRKKRAPMELFSLEGGLQTLIDALQRQLSIEVALNCCVKGVGARVVTSRGDFAGDLIVSALPAEEISRALGVELEVPCRSLWVVHLGFSGKVLKRKGFGYLVPTEENERILGMVWDSEIFPGGSETRLTAMIREESEAPVEDALDALRRHLGIEEKPEFISSHFALRAIPQFEVGHKEKIARFEETIARQFPHVLLTGNYLDGASLEACVARSWALLEDKRLKALQPQSEEDC